MNFLSKLTIEIRTMVVVLSIFICLQSGCQMSSCLTAKTVNCEYISPAPLADSMIRARCCETEMVIDGRESDPLESVAVELQSNMVELPQYGGPIMPSEPQVHWPEKDTKRTAKRRKIPKTPLVENYY